MQNLFLIFENQKLYNFFYSFLIFLFGSEEYYLKISLNPKIFFSLKSKLVIIAGCNSPKYAR